MKCKNCGKEFEGLFCPECGTQVQGEINLCPVCGKERNGEEKFCSNCGYKFEGQFDFQVQDLQQSEKIRSLGNSKSLSIVAKIYKWLLPIGMLLLGLVSLLCLAAPTVTEEFLGMKNNCCSGFVAIGNGANVDVPELVVNASRALLIISIVALVYGTVQLIFAIKKPYITAKKLPLWIIDGAISIVLIVLGSVVSDIAKKEGLNGKAGAGFVLCIVMGVFGLIFLAVRIVYELKIFKWEDTGLSQEQIENLSSKKENKKLNKKKVIAIVVPIVVVAVLIAVIVPTIMSVTNIFKSSKVDKIKIGDTQEQVIEMLGEPYDKNDYRYEYYSDNYVKVLEQIDKILGTSKSNLTSLSNDDDWNFDWDEDIDLDEDIDIGGDLSNLEKLYEQLNEMDYKYIRIDFDSDKKVSEVFFDNNRNNGRSAEENIKSVKEYKSVGNTNIQQYDTLKLTYTVKYNDGSLFKGTAVNQVYFDISKDSVEWKDKYGNKFSSNIKVSPITKLTADVISYITGGNKGALTEFEVASNITTIEANTFEGCNNLSSIVIPNNVTDIGSNAFKNCDNLTIYCYANSRPSNWSSSWNLDRPVYWNSKGGYIASNGISYVISTDNSVSMTISSDISGRVVIPSEIEYKGENYAITSIGANTFAECTNITSLEIPSSIINISATAFDDCVNLRSIKVDEDNSIYASQDGILYNKDKTTFICIPKAISGAIQIPKGITQIPDNLFQNRSNLTGVELPNSVISIGIKAFYNCSGLTSLIIPSSIMSIDEFAFDGCNNITSATLPTSALGYIEKRKLISVIINGGNEISDQEFANCSTLSSIDLQSNIVSIGERAFYNCVGLTNIKIPSSVTSVGLQAFYGCSNLAGVYITDIASWCKIEFSDANANPLSFAHKLYLNDVLVTNLEIPSEVTSIGAYAFSGVSNLTSVNLLANLTSIGVSAFAGCDNVTTAILPTIAIGSISKDKLQSVVINGGEIITNTAFNDCSSLKDISISSSVIDIGTNAFLGCNSLESIQVDANNRNYATVNGILYDKYKTEIIVIPKAIKGAVEIPNGVLKIGENAFADCIGITSIAIPSSIQSVGESAFDGCNNLNGVYIIDVASWCEIEFANEKANPLYNAHNLYLNNNLVTKLEVPSTVISIGAYAFYGCCGLTGLVLPSGIVSIGTSAFSGCDNIITAELPTTAITSITRSKLQSVVINGGEEIPSGAFNGCSNLTGVEIANSVTSIGQFAFASCGITSIKIPSSVISIAWQTFNGCSRLTSVIFENNSGWYYAQFPSSTIDDKSSISANVTNPYANATNITSTYQTYYWKNKNV